MLSFFAILVVALILFWFHSRLSALEEITRARSGIQQTSKQTSAVSQSSVLQQPPGLQPHTPADQQTEPSAFDRLIVWAKEDWLLKLGAGLLLIGFGWLATYAFANNWIGPMGRIALGLVAGVLILLLGWWRIKKYVYQGSTFLVLGSSVILLTTFAAREVYDFFTPLTALGIMFLSAVFVAFASVVYRHLPLALASLLLAGIAPLLTNSSNADFVSLFSYLFVVTIGTVWVVAITGWRALGTAALIMIAFWSLPQLFVNTSLDVGIILGFVFAFTAVFFITSILGVLKLAKEKVIPDLVTVGGTGLFLLVWIVMAAPEEWKSLLLVVWTLVFSCGGFLAFRLTRRVEPFYMYLGVSIAMLAAATAVELQGAALVIAYAVESGIISLTSYAILRNIRTAQMLNILLLGPAYLSITSVVSRSWNTGVFHKDFFVLLVMALLLFGLGLFFFWLKKRSPGPMPQESSHVTAALLIAGSAYVYVLLWLSLHATTLSDDIATMVSLVVYTVVGLATYFYGKTREKNIMRVYGAVLLTLVVGRLLLIDVWDMALAGRIVTFFLVGILLTTTAFFGRGKKMLPLVIIVGLGVATLYVASAEAVTLGGLSQTTIRAYRQFKELQPASILVPTVVEVPFEDAELERLGFSVLDATTETFQPFFFKQETVINRIPTTVSAASIPAIQAAQMTDNNLETYTAFVLPETAQGNAQIVVQATKPITSSSLTLLLDNHVALPTSIEIRAQIGSGSAIVLAKTSVRQSTVWFPRTTSQRWTITVTYSQPLRIAELKLVQENVTQTSSHALRFLAQPNRVYHLYFNPDRYVTSAVGEAGNLTNNQDVLRLPSLASQTNPYYLQADADADGIPDILDNCVSTSNRDQVDVNANGRGDACDDFDRDGIINQQDNCPNNPNKGQGDVDADGIGDICDTQEDRITERYAWIPWVGIGFAAITLVTLFALTARATLRSRSQS